MYVCVCVCICLVIFGESCFVHFSKEKCCMRWTDGRQLLLLPLAVPLPPSAPSPRSPCPRHSSSFSPIPIPTPNPRSPVNNKSSCACQSLFEKQPFGYEIGRGSKQISSSSSNSSHRSQSPPVGFIDISQMEHTKAVGKAKWKKKAHFSFNFRACQLKMPTFIYKTSVTMASLLSLPPNSTPIFWLCQARIIHFRYCSRHSTAAGGHFLLGFKLNREQDYWIIMKLDQDWQDCSYDKPDNFTIAHFVIVSIFLPSEISGQSWCCAYLKLFWKGNFQISR